VSASRNVYVAEWWTGGMVEWWNQSTRKIMLVH